MYRLHVEIPTLPTPLAIANEDIHAYYISLHVVNALQGNERKLFLAIERVLPGMTNPSGLPDGDPARTSFRVSPRGLFAYARDRLGPAVAVLPEEKYAKNPGPWDALFAGMANGQYPSGILPNFPKPKSPHVGLLVTLFAYIRHAKLDDDEKPVSMGSKIGKYRQKEIAQAFIPAHEIALVRDEAILKIPWEGNDSGALSVLTNRVEVVMHADDELEKYGERFGGDQSRAQTHLKVHVRCVKPDPWPREKWQALGRDYQDRLDDTLHELRQTHAEMERAYLACFEPFQNTAMLNASAMRSRKWGKLAPLTGDMTTFHVIRFQTYQLGPHEGRVDEEGHNSLWLPIWAYSWPYQLRDWRRGPLHSSVQDHLQAFLQNVFLETCAVYSLRPEEVAGALAPFTREGQARGVDWTHLGPARSVVLDMLCLGDFCSHFLTVPAFKASYTSDYRYGPMRDPRTGEIRMGRLNTESQDLGLVCSQCGSDDCEGCEQATLKMYGLVTHPTDGGLASPMEGLRYLAHYLLDHFEYIGTAISTTSAYPGDVSVDDVMDVVVGIDHVHFVKQHSLGDGRECNTPNKCKKDQTVLRNMQYGSPFDQELHNTFHQNSVLIPSIEMYHLLDLTGEDRPDRNMAEKVKKAQKGYYRHRARESLKILKTAARHLGLVHSHMDKEEEKRAIMKMAPVAINMESTHPVSTFLVGPSVQIMGRFPPPKTGLDDWSRALLAEDWQCARDAGPMRRLIFDVFDEARPRELHSLRTLPGYPVRKEKGQGWELRTVDEFAKPHYGSTFYHLLCHGMNSTLMRSHMVDSMKDRQDFTDQEIGAMSHMTFCAARSNLFGVPLESFLYETLKSSSDGCRTQHPFSLVPARVLQKYDALLNQVEAEARLAPIHLGRVEGETLRSPEPQVWMQGTAGAGIDAYFDRSIASRIMRTRYVALDSVGAEDRSKIESVMHVLVNDVLGKATVEKVFTCSGKMFAVFGEESTGLVCLKKPARVDP